LLFLKKQQKPRLARVGVFLVRPMKEGEGQPGGLRRPNHAQRLGQSLPSAQKKTERSVRDARLLVMACRVIYSPPATRPEGS
jgi:hypothetical protein